MTAGTIPSGGFAEGAPDVSNWEARVMSMYRYVQAFGIRPISYEGGWYPGGDANKNAAAVPIFLLRPTYD